MKSKNLMIIAFIVVLLVGVGVFSFVINAATNIPGQVEAESYSAMYGIQTEACSDTGGGLDVGWTDAGDWMDYSLNVQTTGTYSVDFRVSSPYNNTQFQLKNGATVLATITVPNTGGYQTWATVTAANVNLTAGAQTLRVYCVTNGHNLNWLKFNLSGGATPTITKTPTISRSPSGATAIATKTPTPTVTSTVTPGGDVLATGLVATASSNIMPAANSCDSNIGTRWESTQGVDPQWIYWDLGSAKTLSRIVIEWEVASAATYNVDVSNDAVNWTTQANVTNASQVDHNKITTNLSGSYRYVRMYGKTRVTQWGYSIWEAYIYVINGPAPTPTVTKTPTPTITKTPTPGVPTPTVTPGNFWGDTSNIPPAQNVMTLKFINRTNGKYPDSQVFWSFKSGSINEVHSIAEQSTYDMPANSAGRMYFGLGVAPNPANFSSYWDFIEFTIGPTQFNGNTTRVDAFGLKLAMRMHCADGYDVEVGENQSTFAEDRSVTFQRYTNSVPAEFQNCAQVQYPYRIVEPGAAGFNEGGPYANYYNSYIDQMWANNGITIPKPGPNGSGLGAYPDLSAAIFRHVGAAAGNFNANGSLKNQALWANPSTFYQAAPAHYYAKFCHDISINGLSYGFPYDDVGGYSSYISHGNPQWLIVAIGW